MEQHEQQEHSSSAAISDAAVRVLRDYTGRGPTKAKTTISPELVTIVMGDTLTKGEAKLVEAGKADTVLDLRRSFQETMADELVYQVERALGRNVVAFMSTNHIDPDLAVEVFVLAPNAEQAPGAG